MKSQKKWHTTVAFWGFVGPLVIGLLVFVYVPIIWGLILSFFTARGTLTPQALVGFQNYTDILGDPEFIRSLENVIFYTVMVVPLTFCTALGLALIINGTRFGQGFFRSIFFIPTACSYVVASMVWRMTIFNGLPYGLANTVLGWFNLDPVVWISSRTLSYWLVLITARLWLQAGFFMIIFLAGLQDIPRTLYEAAYVDGARPSWDTFRHITFPLLRNTSITVLLLCLIWAFQAFDEFYNILGGSTASAANLTLARPPLIYLLSVAFSDQNYGRGNAGAFILTALILCVTIFQARLFGFGKSENEI